MMYQPHPATGPQGQVRILPPRTVRAAVRLMYFGAVLEVPALIIAVATRGSFRSAILRFQPASPPAQLHTADATGAVPLIVGAVLIIGLWLWMAWANGRGFAWARVVSVGLFVISTLDLTVSLILIRAPADMAVDVVIWLVGLAAVALLLSRESGPFYRPGGRTMV
jgi:hypothetical protein